MAGRQIAVPVANTEKLSLWQKIGYGMGDIYGGGTAALVSFYYLIFLTDVIRLNPALAGTVILISKVYDAITDPFEGVISDRTRTRLGRRRPYLLAGIPLIFLSFFALFYPVNFSQEIQRFFFVICAYLFYSTVISLVMLNYNALQSEMTLDYNERTALSSSRIFFSTVSSILSALLPMEIVKRSAGVQQGYILMGLVFGAFFALPFIATIWAARERKEFQKTPDKFNLRDTLLEPFKVRTFVLALGMFLFTFLAADTVSSIMIYFMKYYLHRGDEANYVAGTMLIFQVISLVFFTGYARRTSKQVGLITGLVIWMVTMAFSLLLKPGSPPFAVYIFAAMVGVGTGGMYLNIYAILPDLPDVDELRTGERREGVFGALITLMRKTSSAAGIFIVSNILAAAGYAQPVLQVVNGTTRLIDQPQNEGFILILRLIFALIPTVLLSIAILIALRYPLTASIHARLNRVLSSRRAEEAETLERQGEAEELGRVLIGREKIQAGE